MADNQKLQLVKEVNATMERYGVQSQLPLNKAMTVGEFSELVSKIKIPLISEEIVKAFEDFFGNSNRSYCLIVVDGDLNVPGFVTIQTDKMFEKDFQGTNTSYLISDLTPKPSNISIDSESAWLCSCLIARDGRVVFDEGVNHCDISSLNCAVFAIVYYWFK